MTQMSTLVGADEPRAVGMESSSSYDRHVYVDKVNGFDGNRGSIESPLQTTRALIERYPQFLANGARLIVHYAGAGADGFNAPTGVLTYDDSRTLLVYGGEALRNSICIRGPKMAPYNPAAGIQSGAVTAVAAVGKRTRIDRGAANPWTAQALRGQFVRIMRAGVMVCFELWIADNDADSLFIDDEAFAAIVQVGDTLQLVQPAVIFTGDAANFNELSILGRGSDGPIFNIDTTQNCATFERVAFDGVTWVSGNGVTFDRCRITNLQVVGGWCDMVNSVIAFGCTWGGGCVNQQWNGRADAVGNPLNASSQLGFMLNSQGANGFGVGRRDVSGTVAMPGVYVAKWNCSMYDVASRAALEAFGPSLFYANNGPKVVALQGDNTCSIGILVSHGAEIRVNGGTDLAVGNTGDDINVDVLITAQYGNGAGQFEEAAGYNGNIVGIKYDARGSAARITTVQ